ncbi:hypothetical protein COLO4_11079 [Corchorus olitorius]|uniref:Uncharacterized protein n=1 Tax=Corchorus olitorius TaxID=93759 RepID=A0A1R3K5S9_9ROSI|nr:hypothetical protein COLO4_11079 [Corchorus olitorius]
MEIDSESVLSFSSLDSTSEGGEGLEFGATVCTGNISTWRKSVSYNTNICITTVDLRKYRTLQRS